ncbi:MAG: helix-turn-helix transcriptional regulator [bacterium]|nr:helix-turn-helix transcriptional regulator [bacterium]
MDRQTRERQTRRQWILEGTRRVFAEKGVENTSMEDIAAAVDYTRRTLYAYFKSRDEICLAVFMEDLAARWDRQRKAVAPVAEGRSKLMRWAEVYYDYAREYPHSVRLQAYWDYRGIDRDRIGGEIFAAFELLNDELADGLRDMVRLGMEDGSLRSDLQVDLTISQFLYTLRAAIFRAVSPGYSFATFDADEYVRHYLDLFGRAVGRSGGGSS